MLYHTELSVHVHVHNLVFTEVELGHLNVNGLKGLMSLVYADFCKWVYWYFALVSIFFHAFDV